jgi:hypothetical protein
MAYRHKHQSPNQNVKSVPLYEEKEISSFKVFVLHIATELFNLRQPYCHETYQQRTTHIEI